MIYFSFLEIVCSVFAFLFLGLAIGFFHAVFNEIFLSLRRLLMLLFYSVTMRIEFARPQKKQVKYRAPKNMSLLYHFVDFFRFLFYGISYIIVLYAVLDAEFRIYSLIITVVCSYISFKSFGNLFARIYNIVFDFIYKTLYWVLKLIVLPIKKIGLIIYACIWKLTAPVRKKYRMLHSGRIIKKKISEIEVLFSKKLQKL